VFSNIVSATVDANLVNLPPVANAGLDRSVARGTRVTLDGRGSLEPNGDPLTYAWTQTAGTPVTLADADSAQPSFTAPAATGLLTFVLEVRDPNGSSSVDAVNVVVTAGAVGNNQLFGGSLPPLTPAIAALLALARRRPRR
jgi:hypothetical protein